MQDTSDKIQGRSPLRSAYLIFKSNNRARSALVHLYLSSLLLYLTAYGGRAALIRLRSVFVD
jgi:hypothetical protein